MFVIYTIYADFLNEMVQCCIFLDLIFSKNWCFTNYRSKT